MHIVELECVLPSTQPHAAYALHPLVTLHVAQKCVQGYAKSLWPGRKTGRKVSYHASYLVKPLTLTPDTPTFDESRSQIQLV